MGLLSVVVDRAVNRSAVTGAAGASDLAQAIHASSAIVDLVVGSALFRHRFLTAGRGLVDLPRLQSAGVNVVGLTVATRFPDLRGTLSNWHFRSLGAPAAALRSNMALADWHIGRIERWVTESGGRLLLIRRRADLERCLAPGGPVGILLGVQGGHVLGGQLTNAWRLHRLGVRMLSPAHVMDNDLVGSGTGRARGGLTGLGREAIGELERVGIMVDLAHMSRVGLEQALPLLRRPFLLSHTGLVEIHGAGSRWRRYSPATRNVPAELARLVGQSGGLVGAVLATALNGGGLERAVELIQRLVAEAGRTRVAIGSDMDGALRGAIDAAGLPLLTDALLSAGLERATVEGVMGGNAASFLRAALPA